MSSNKRVVCGHTGGRKKTSVSILFKPASQVSKMERVQCSFCNDVMSKSGTRMAMHIKKCKKCPVEAKYKLLNECTIMSKKITTEKIQRKATCKFKNLISSNSTNVTSIISDLLKNFEPISKSGKSCSMFDSMKQYEKESIDAHLSRAIYASGSPMSLVDNKYWKTFLKNLRPAYQLPSRYEVSNTLLDKEFNRISSNVKESIAIADSVGLMCDGWSNIRNEAIINFVLTLPSSLPILWKSLPSGSSSHSGEYIADEIRRVLEEINPKKVMGIVTDNAANMKKAWKLLKISCPLLNCYGCISHGLNLLFNDFIKIPTLCVLMSQATDIVKEIKNSHIIGAIFKEIQKSTVDSNISLKLPVKTRWGSTVACLESIQKNKQSLKSLAISERCVLNSTTKNSLLSDIFWDNVQGFLKLLAPIADAIKITEADSPMLSSIVEIFYNLENNINQNIVSSPLTKKEEVEMKELFAKRKKFCLTKVHMAANLLDPKYQGRYLNGEQKIDACEVIYSIAVNSPNIKIDILMADLANYQCKGGVFSKTFIWTAVDLTFGPNWWKGLCSSTELAKVAAKILQLPVTSAACERSFSSYANIHSAKRNRLTNERAAKLVFVSQNLKLEAIDMRATQ